MLKRVGTFAVMASLFAMAGCSFGGQTPQPSTASGFSANHVGMPSVSPDKDCGGTGGVVVSPCPVQLTKDMKSGIVVTVSGPGVVSSNLGTIKGCFSGKKCYHAARNGASKTEWLITPGAYCSRADVQFNGRDARHRVGYFFLAVSNRYCP